MDSFYDWLKIISELRKSEKFAYFSLQHKNENYMQQLTWVEDRNGDPNGRCVI